jgi:integrase
VPIEQEARQRRGKHPPPKDGGWCAQYTVYTDKGRKRKTIYGKTRQEVATKLAKALSDRESGLTFDAGNLTLGDYLNRWLHGSVRDSVKQRTFENYEGVVRKHLVPVLGRIKLKALTPAHVQELYRCKMDSGLSSGSVRNIHATLHKALKQAVRWSLVPRNVTEATTAPRFTKKEMQPLTPDHARTLLDAARGDRFEALYVLAITTGLRRGELLGLRWQDVDLKRGYLQVRQQLIRTKKGLSFTTPKGSKSRSVKLTQRAVDALKSHRKRQLEDKLRLAGLWEDADLVFTTKKGTPFHPDSLTKRSFEPLMKRAGLPQIRFHDLRHTFATVLLAKGTHPKVVQEMLGHASISQTIDTYSHVLPDLQSEAAAAMEDVLSEEPEDGEEEGNQGLGAGG